MPILAAGKLNGVRECLAEASGLADDFIAERYDFPDQVGDWLERLESVAAKAGLTVVPALAGLRVELEAAAQGLSQAPATSGRMTRRKARKTAAQSTLRAAINLVSAAMEPFEIRQSRAEAIALDVAARSFAKNLWPGQSNAPGAPNDMPSMWQAMIADPVLGPLVMELSALTGMAQGMVLTAQSMNDFANGPSRAGTPTHR